MVTEIIGGTIGAVGQLGASIYGAAQSKKYNDRARALLDQQKAENRSWYEDRMASDYTKRSDVQRAFQKQRQLLSEFNKQNAGASVVSGGGDIAQAINAEQANKSLADTMSDVAAGASSYKDNIENQFRSADANYTNQQRANLEAQGQAVAQAAGQAGQTFQTFGESISKIKA